MTFARHNSIVIRDKTMDENLIYISPTNDDKQIKSLDKNYWLKKFRHCQF